MSDTTFGEYTEQLRKQRDLSLRSTAKAVGVSPQYYSEIERGHRSALTPERLEKLRDYLGLTSEETETLFNKSAEARKVSEFDFSDYIRRRDYVMRALRVAKEIDATKEDWARFLNGIMDKYYK